MIDDKTKIDGEKLKNEIRAKKLTDRVKSMLTESQWSNASLSVDVEMLTIENQQLRQELEELKLKGDAEKK